MTTAAEATAVLDDFAQGWHIMKAALQKLEPAAELAAPAVEAIDPVAADILRLAPEAKTLVAGLVAMLRTTEGSVDPTTSPTSGDSAAASTTATPEAADLTPVS